MEFYVMAKSYNMYGAHTTLTPIAKFLLMGAVDFGDAVQELTVTLYFSNSGPPKKNLQQLLEQHNTYRSTLPKITYRKAKGKIEINVASELVDDWGRKASPRLSLPLFERGVDEVCRALALMRNRIKDSDAFDLEAFLAHCEAARHRLPTSDDALQELAAALGAAEKAKREALSPWEKLGIEWEDFHPRAREILDDPFFWDIADGFSPNGSDTGADLLVFYRDWLKAHGAGEPMRFLELLWKQWGYADIEARDDDVRFEAIIGLAFAELKLRGSCDEDVRKLAIESIHQQRTQADAATGWPNRIERLESLKKIENKLMQRG